MNDATPTCGFNESAPTIKVNTGGPAFPRSPVQVHEDGKLYSVYKGGQNGMTLRDYFAGQALAGDWVAQSAEIGEFTDSASDDLLRKRTALYYRMADAMIAEREKETHE